MDVDDRLMTSQSNGIMPTHLLGASSGRGEMIETASLPLAGNRARGGGVTNTEMFRTPQRKTVTMYCNGHGVKLNGNR